MSAALVWIIFASLYAGIATWSLPRGDRLTGALSVAVAVFCGLTGVVVVLDQ